MSDPQGLAFDPVAADYDLGRPGWPPELLDGIEGNDVLDLAAGTGKLTRLLVHKYPHVVAVEPLASMRVFITDEAEVLAEPPIGDAARAALEERWSRLPPPGGPNVQSGEWKLGLEGLPFTPLVERAIDHEFETDREGVAAYYVSVSSIGLLSEDERQSLRRNVLAALADVPYRLSLTARVFSARRR